MTANPNSHPRKALIICERDVGLFSLIQQVVSNIPRAFAEGRVPIVYFGNRCCYFTPKGYAGHDSVWEYYFEPVIESAPISTIPPFARARIDEDFPGYDTVGYEIDESIYVSNHFGDHPQLRDRSLIVHDQWHDPGAEVRSAAADLIGRYIRPRSYIRRKVEKFYEENLAGSYVIGVHLRGTDSLTGHEPSTIRLGSLNYEKYRAAIQSLLTAHPDAKVFAATDDERSLNFMKETFGSRVIAHPSIRHREGNVSGLGPTGWSVVGFISHDRDVAAKSGEEVVIEYHLLCRCNHLVHNGAGLARTVLLTKPDLQHTNTHRPKRMIQLIRGLTYSRLKHRAIVRIRRFLPFARKSA